MAVFAFERKYVEKPFEGMRYNFTAPGTRRGAYFENFNQATTQPLTFQLTNSRMESLFINSVR